MQKERRNENSWALVRFVEQSSFPLQMSVVWSLGFPLQHGEMFVFHRVPLESRKL